MWQLVIKVITDFKTNTFFYISSNPKASLLINYARCKSIMSFSETYWKFNVLATDTHENDAISNIVESYSVYQGFRQA